MNTFYKFALLCIGICFIHGCKSYKVHHITNNFDYNKIKSNGIIYYLPKTELVITLEVTKTTYTKGVYSQYSTKLLNISNPHNTSYSHYAVSNIYIEPKSLPDSNYMYFIEFPSKCRKKNSSLHLNFAEYGILSEINYTAYPTKKTKNQRIDSISFDNNEKNDNKQIIIYNLYEKTDTILEKILVDSNIIERKTFKTRTATKTEEQKAIETASIIMDLRDARIKLLTGESEVPYDAKTIRYMCEQLEHAEKQYLELFTGKINTSKQTYKFFINPQNCNEIIPICSFDVTNGINNTNMNNNINISFSPYTSIAINNKLLQQKTSSNSLFTKIPNCFKVDIQINNNILHSQIINIAQFSKAIALPTSQIKLKINETEGSLQKIHVK